MKITPWVIASVPLWLMAAILMLIFIFGLVKLMREIKQESREEIEARIKVGSIVLLYCCLASFIAAWVMGPVL